MTQKSVSALSGLLLSCLVLPSAQAQNLVNGGSVQGAISPALDVDTYTFFADAGDGIQVRVADTGATSLAPLMTIFQPGGGQVAIDFDLNVAIAAFAAPLTGVYTVTVQDHASSGTMDTGPYSVYYTRAPGANEWGALPNGGSVAGTIELGDLDSYTFDAVQGKWVSIRVADTSGGTLAPEYVVYGPGGNSVASANHGVVAAHAFVPAESGTYTLVVTDHASSGTDDTGSYVVYLAGFPGAGEGGSLVPGGVQSGWIDPGDLDTYSFDAVQGDSLHLRVADIGATSLSPEFAIVLPGGELFQMASGTAVASHSFTAPVTGEYGFVVSDSGSISYAQSGGYEVHFVRVPGDNLGVALLDGDTVTGDITLGEIDSYTFLGSAGQAAQIVATDLDGSTFRPRLSLFDPNGQLLGAATDGAVATVNQTLPAYGQYSVFVWDGNASGAGTGAYSLSLDGSGLHPSQLPNVQLDAELVTDPKLADIGGDPGLGPRIGNSAQPFNFSIDCTGASAASLYAIQVRSTVLANPVPLALGDLHVAGTLLLEKIGAHNQTVETWFPAPTGFVLPAAPALVGFTYSVQGLCLGQGGAGRLTNAISQTIAN